MSSAYAIAGVTAVLQGIVEQGLVDHGTNTALGSDATVSAVSPDRVTNDPGLNLFFYQATPNSAWRNECLPVRNSRSERLTNQPLALDLHYLISVNAETDLFSEILLGSVMQTLHEKPFFDRNEIRNLLSPPPLPEVDPILNMLDAAGLADQIEQIQVTPEYLSNEDMSKLWSAVQSNYRPSAAYVTTVVLIEAKRPEISSLPVLRQEISVRPDLIPPTPSLLTVEYPNKQPVVRLSETVVITGYNLNGLNSRAQLLMQSEGIVVDIPISTIESAQRVEFEMPDDTSQLRVGTYQLSLNMDNDDGNSIKSNTLPLTIAPEFSAFNAIRNLDDSVSVSLIIAPEIHDNQSVSLILGQAERPVEEFSGSTNNAEFEFPTIEAGSYWARIRVDGIDSVLIDRSVVPPQFVASQQVVVP